MANPSKRKGDRAEREAVAALRQQAPDLLVARPERMLGAGRLDDIGDLRVFDDVTVQVKSYKDVARALRLAASGAEDQRKRAGLDYALGMVPVPRAPLADPTRVRWLAVAIDWPDPTVGQRALTETLTMARCQQAVAWLRDPKGELALTDRIVELEHRSLPTLWVGTLQAWLADYRMVTGQMIPPCDDHAADSVA